MIANQLFDLALKREKGFIIEPVYINFNPRVSLVKQGLKLLAGLGVLLLIKVYVKALLPEALWSDFFRYYLMGIWVTIIAPFLFKVFIDKYGYKVSSGSSLQKGYSHS